MNWDDLTREIITDARSVFSKLLEQHKDEHFYAFALYTDDDGFTVVPAANSIEKYDANMLHNNVTNIKSQIFRKWYSGSWAYEDCGDDEFNAICGKLSDACMALPEDDDEAFHDFTEHVHSCMINALQILDNEGFWGAARKNIVLFVTISDSDEAEELENRSAQILNPPEIYEKFLKRYEVNSV